MPGPRIKVHLNYPNTVHDEAFHWQLIINRLRELIKELRIERHQLDEERLFELCQHVALEKKMQVRREEQDFLFYQTEEQ